MNNKGFAITGILYTLFVFFMLLIIASLAALSFKREMLSKTINGLEDDFSFEVETSENKLKWVVSKNNKYFANFDGKYVFELVDTWNNKSLICYAYLNKGDEITPSNFESVMIPAECNTLLSEILLNTVIFSINESDRVININTNINANTKNLSLNLDPTVTNTKVMPVVEVEHDFILTKAYKFKGSE